MLVHCLGEFSRQNCLAICAALVPLNLLATLGTMILAYGHSPWRWATGAIALTFAHLLILHVVSWWVVGVVMLPTFILPLLALLCLGINGLLLWRPAIMVRLAQWAIRRWTQSTIRTNPWRTASKI